MKRFILAISMAASILPMPLFAEFSDKTIVYIECSTDGGKSRKGTGVIVSSKGKILTAEHVVSKDPNTDCKGRIGHAFLGGLSILAIQRDNSPYDVAVLKFPVLDGEKIEFLKYCKLNDSMLRQTIFSTGFPVKTQTGKPSSRLGVLSTIEADPRGFIETDSLTTRGMSGGMVTLAGKSSLIGIVAGADFDPGTGQPKYYAMLSAEIIAQDINLTAEKDENCFNRSKLTIEYGIDGSGKKWHTGQSQLKLGVHKDEGFCFLTGVWGVFGSDSGKSDMVKVKVDSMGEYVLTGTEVSGETHGGFARCILF